MLIISLVLHYGTMYFGNHSVGAGNTVIGVYRKLGLQADGQQ